MNGAFTRSFLTGERHLPAGMDIAIDTQSLMVNWPSSVSGIDQKAFERRIGVFTEMPSFSSILSSCP